MYDVKALLGGLISDTPEGGLLEKRAYLQNLMTRIFDVKVC